MMQIQRRTAFALRALFALLIVTRTTAAQEPFPGLDAYIEKSVKLAKIPGVAVAIVRNDSVLYTKGFGVLAAGGHAPVNEQTLFEIGSSSKAFTATIVAMMVSDGKMKFDDLVSKYLPDFKLADPVASSLLTIRDAMTHRSGIGRAGDPVWIDAGMSRAELLHRVRFVPTESVFRSHYAYQNLMYLAAGEAAGKAAGSTWDELIQQRIFNPLGMTSSAPTYRGLKNTNVARPHTMDHDTAVVRTPFSGDGIAPAGAILSNAHDMAQWLRFHLNDGVVNGKPLVSSVAFREMHIPQMLVGTPANELTLFSTYGMGLFIEDYRHELMWQHGGNTQGMTTAVGMLPQKKFGVVVLSSMASAQLPGQLMHYIFDRQLGILPVKDFIADGIAARAARGGRGGGAGGDSTAVPAGPHVPTPAPLPLTAYVGTFRDSLYGDAVVSIENGRLNFVRGELHGPLEYWNASNFRWTNGPVGSTYVKFDVTPDGRVLGVSYGALKFAIKGPAGGRGGRGGR
jgi:CubicO group peptidase (beta-lactamase class C family)